MQGTGIEPHTRGSKLLLEYRPALLTLCEIQGAAAWSTVARSGSRDV